MPASDLAQREKLIWPNLPQLRSWEAMSPRIKDGCRSIGKGTNAPADFFNWERMGKGNSFIEVYVVATMLL